MSEQARAIWKDDEVVMELIVVITKPEQKLTDSTTANDLQCDIVYHRCGGASQLSGQEDKAVCCYVSLYLRTGQETDQGNRH